MLEHGTDAVSVKAIAEAAGVSARDGGLAAGWSAESAADRLWAELRPAAYAHLAAWRGWTAEDYAERTVPALLGAVLASAART